MEEINIHAMSAYAGVAGVARQAEVALGSLEDRLLTLRLSFGKLRAAIERAFAPIRLHIADAIAPTIRRLTDFANSAGAVIGALFGTVQEKAVKTVRTSGKALRRFLADFDEIHRLGTQNSGSGTTTQTVEIKTITPELTPELQEIADKIRAFFAPLQEISLENLTISLNSLGQAAATFASGLGETLLWAWHNIFVPLAQWTIEDAAPAAVNLLTAALNGLTAAAAPVLEALRTLFGELQPMFQTLGQTWLTAVQSATAAVTAGLSGLTEFLSGVFSGNWSAAWEGLKTIAKAAANGIIGHLNAMLSALVAGLNAAAQQLNKLQFTAPEWLPGIGGRSFGLNIPTLTAPQIPQLARGAVIPPNAPFLAMLGDQHSGTNIEAPLSTIQEAVAATMEDYAAATLAGHEATVDVLQQILEAVLGIELGDEVLGAAANRYNTRLAAMRGDG